MIGLLVFCRKEHTTYCHRNGFLIRRPTSRLPPQMTCSLMEWVTSDDGAYRSFPNVLVGRFAQRD